VSKTVAVPERVRRKALAVGADGERWLDDIGRLVEELATEWELEVGDAIVGGSGAYVAPAVTAGGVDAVLKLAIPDGLDGHCPFAQELETLLLGSGHGFVEVLRSDEHRRATLQERLGRPLSDLALPVESQIDVIASTLSRVWHQLPVGTGLRTGAEQASELGGFVRAQWEEQGRPCPLQTIERAEQYARARRDAFDPSTAVLIHGDAHPANVLETTRDQRVPMEFKLIDPDGMVSEPAHDLAIPLRDWTAELLAAADAVELGLSWCARLASRSGVEPRAIWEWAFLERVSTGVFLMQLGETAHGEQFLAVAALWTGAQP
jgi:streptomycin 6-kinase